MCGCFLNILGWNVAFDVVLFLSCVSVFLVFDVKRIWCSLAVALCVCMSCDLRVNS